MKIIQTIFYSFFVLLLIGVAGLFVVPLLPIAHNIQIKIVESGSMEPTIRTGSLVVVKPHAHYVVGDIITFKSLTADIPTTHRIVAERDAAGEKFFMTKGDANKSADTNETREEAVIGKVALAIPYVGYVLDFARQPLGFFFLIVIPALLIIFSEMEKIWIELRKQSVKKRKQSMFTPTMKEPPANPPLVRMIDIARPIYIERPRIAPITLSDIIATKKTRQLPEYVMPILVVAASLLVVGMGFASSTVSYFSDGETSSQNMMSAGALDFTASAEGTDYTFLTTGQLDSSSSIVSVVSPVPGSVPVSYAITVEYVSGNSAFCNAITADAGTPVSYMGTLLGLSAHNVTFAHAWQFTVSLDPAFTDYTATDTCAINVVYTAHRQGTDGTSGYFDIEKVPLEFYAPQLPPAPTVHFSSLLSPTEGDSTTTPPTDPVATSTDESIGATTTESIPAIPEDPIPPTPPVDATATSETV